MVDDCHPALQQEGSADECETYGRAVASKLRCLSAYQRATARVEIEKLLFNIQYNTPVSNSSVSNTLVSNTPASNTTSNVAAPNIILVSSSI